MEEKEVSGVLAEKVPGKVGQTGEVDVFFGNRLAA
jgi:hypothetical protein